MELVIVDVEEKYRYYLMLSNHFGGFGMLFHHINAFIQ